VKDTNGQNRAERMTQRLGECRWVGGWVGGWGLHYEKESGAVETRYVLIDVFPSLPNH
jgi:hypothetical protein